MGEVAEFQTTRLLHQILIVDGFDLPDPLPPDVVENARALQVTYPSAEYRLWDGLAIRELLQTHFEPEVIAAFDLLEPYAFKCDLARLCVLYVFGGLYVDIGVRSHFPIKPPMGVGLVAHREYELGAPSWVAVSNAFIWAVPQRDEFRIAIDYIVENCRNRFYGRNPIYPTGPVCFGRALIAAMAKRRQGYDADDQWVGFCRAITPSNVNQNMVFVAPDQSVVAIRSKRIPADLSHLGLAGTNDYGKIWHNKNVYGEQRLNETEWPFDDPRLLLTEIARRTDRGIVAVGTGTGNLTFGPYIDLEAGQYHLSLHLEGDIELPRMLLDVAHSGGEQHAVLEIEAGPRRNPAVLELTFTTREKLQNFEFRAHVFGPMKGLITKFRLQRLPYFGGVSSAPEVLG